MPLGQRASALLTEAARLATLCQVSRKGDRTLLPERPEGVFAQKGPVPFLRNSAWNGIDEGVRVFAPIDCRGANIRKQERCGVELADESDPEPTTAAAVGHLRALGEIAHRPHWIVSPRGPGTRGFFVFCGDRKYESLADFRKRLSWAVGDRLVTAGASQGLAVGLVVTARSDFLCRKETRLVDRAGLVAASRLGAGTR